MGRPARSGSQESDDYFKVSIEPTNTKLEEPSESEIPKVESTKEQHKLENTTENDVIAPPIVANVNFGENYFNEEPSSKDHVNLNPIVNQGGSRNDGGGDNPVYKKKWGNKN